MLIGNCEIILEREYMPTNKKAILKNLIEKLKSQKNYFSYNEIKTILKKENVELTSNILKVYLSEFVKNQIIFDAGKGWFSALETPFQLDIKPVQEIINQLLKQFSLLEFSCWSTEQLNTFTHHILTNFITFVYVESDYINSIAEYMEDLGYNVYANPTKKEINKFFKLSPKTYVILPSITKQPQNSEKYSPIEKILIDFLMENQKFLIMEQEEALEVFKNAVNSGRINISQLFSYAKRRKLNIQKELTKSNLLVKVDMVN